ncbi:glycosyltransferase involved in cell wall biosynthesis [Roseiarcus fermentans]|uniref:Glycosyltransferase involved in cell wall biosynthesis n=1 Tax=Roseiarcus fermentans TaxID=1473586 RepID=A0A366FNF2_9HYPH|nr:glycosyltransferase family 4 protein [Roseiarcus fermentans]RBP16097.1 glycosyltransferase involved in cell wall biosynthesis [Roseiarcus fermentans]
MSLPSATAPNLRSTAMAVPAGAIRLLVDSSGIGGIERHIAVLTAALRRRGYDARILLLDDHGDHPWLEQLAAEGLPFDVNRGGVNGLFQRLRAERAGLLHTHGYKAGVLGRPIARLLGVPVVSTFHSGETGRFPVNVYQRLDEWTGLLATRISVSPAIAGRLPFSSRLIANFVATSDRPPTGPLPPAVGFVGRLSHEKGPDLFCLAASASPPDVRWLVFGDGPMRGELQRQYGARVEFRGMVSNIAEAWPEIGLLLMPSRAEGLPMAALEALAAGVPVASARVGAMPDVIRPGENGWLFDAGDLEAVGTIVRAWAGERDARAEAWRLSAWRVAHDRFGVETGLDRTLDAYAAAGFKASPPSRQ